MAIVRVVKLDLGLMQVVSCNSRNKQVNFFNGNIIFLVLSLCSNFNGII